MAGSSLFLNADGAVGVRIPGKLNAYGNMAELLFGLVEVRSGSISPF
jgi:hypothetical protein